MTPEPCPHQWERVDDSFDHAFGTEVIRYDRCELCGETRDSEPVADPDEDRDKDR